MKTGNIRSGEQVADSTDDCSLKNHGIVANTIESDGIGSNYDDTLKVNPSSQI